MRDARREKIEDRSEKADGVREKRADVRHAREDRSRQEGIMYNKWPIGAKRAEGSNNVEKRGQGAESSEKNEERERERERS